MPPKSSDIEVSPMMDFTESAKDSDAKDVTGNIPKNNKFTYALIAVVVLLVLYLAYYAYKSFYDNQCDDEGFIEKTIKTGTESDSEFDMDTEVSKLRRLQEKYLSNVRRR